MSFVVSDLDALDDAIKKGELEVAYDGKQVKYRSIDELIKARTFVYGQLVASGLVTTARKRVSYASFEKDSG